MTAVQQKQNTSEASTHQADGHQKPVSAATTSAATPPSITTIDSANALKQTSSDPTRVAFPKALGVSQTIWTQSNPFAFASSATPGGLEFGAAASPLTFGFGKTLSTTDSTAVAATADVDRPAETTSTPSLSAKA